MKKSPLSMPSGSRGKQSYSWKAQEHKNRTGYGYIKSDNYQCISPNGSQARYGDDFIPLNNSTPTSEQKRYSGNWYGSGGSRNHRNSGSGGFNHYRNNYHATPKLNFNNSYSPYKHSGKQFHGHKKGYLKDAHKQIDISKYIDMKSFLEDPWAELTKRLYESKEANEEISVKTENSVPLETVYRDPKPEYERQSGSHLDSHLSQESKHESSLDMSLGLDDTDVSEVSKAESSIDLKFDDIKFSQESMNENCNINNSFCTSTQKEDNVHDSCDSETGTVQEFI